LRFARTGGEQEYNARYAKPMGRRGGMLAEYGARSTLAAACGPSLLGDVDFDEIIIAE
jgi:hypothetical protein